MARYASKTCNQQVGELLDVCLRKLKQLSIDCNFLVVLAKLCKEEAIRDAFISGILSNKIRQRLLKEHDLSLENIINKVVTFFLIFSVWYTHSPYCFASRYHRILNHATPQYAFIRFKSGHESTVSLGGIAPLKDSQKIDFVNTSNDTVTNIETNNETLAKESNKETNTETVIEKSFDAEMVTESTSSNSKMFKMKLILYGVPLK